MPDLKKQILSKPANGPAPAPRPVVKSGILSTIRPVSEVVSRHKKAVLYGPNRTGKTTLACQFPKPLLVVSFDPDNVDEPTGVQSVKSIADVYCKAVRSSDEALELADALIAQGGFKTVVADDVALLESMVLKQVMGWDREKVLIGFGEISKGQYEQRAEKTKEVLQRFLAIKANVIFTAQEKDHGPPRMTGDGKPDLTPKLIRKMVADSYMAANLGAATTLWLQNKCDYIWRLYLDKEYKTKKLPALPGQQPIEQEYETGKYIRVLRLGYHPNFAAGQRADDLDLPDYIEAARPEEMYKKLMEVIE